MQEGRPLSQGDEAGNASRNVIRGGPGDFLEAQRAAFKSTIDAQASSGGCAHTLAIQAIDVLEANTRRRAEGKPPIACVKGCSTCCRGFRVDATAPEILEVARYIRTLAPADQTEIAEKITAADELTRGLDGSERRRLRDPCPLLGKSDECRVYSSRPLACRGHASYDRQACLDEAAGLEREVPVSLPHLQTRHLVQVALEAALADAGFEPGQYELNHALRIALADPAAEEKWFHGSDVMADALSPISQDPAHGVRAVIARLENHRGAK